MSGTTGLDLSGSLSNLSINRLNGAGAAGSEQSAKKPNELGQSAFLELMIAQLKHQDPMSPQENGEFISQLAQFSSVEGIQSLNSSMAEIAGNFRSSQALQASSLVGRQVQVPGSVSTLGSTGAMGGAVELPKSTGDLRVRIFKQGDSTPLAEIKMGSQAAGEVPFSWDGLDGNGVRVPPGIYTIEATAMQDGKSTKLPTTVNANVNSVTVGANNSMTLNVANVGPVALSDIRKIL